MLFPRLHHQPHQRSDTHPLADARPSCPYPSLAIVTLSSGHRGWNPLPCSFVDVPPWFFPEARLQGTAHIQVYRSSHLRKGWDLQKLTLPTPNTNHHPSYPHPANHLDMKTSVQPRHPLKVWLPSSERPPWIHAGLPVKKKTIRARMQWMMVHHVRQFAQNPKAPPCLSQTRGWHGWACACHPCYRHIVGSLIFPMNHRLSASLDTQVVEKKVNSLSSAAPPLFMCSAI